MILFPERDPAELEKVHRCLGHPDDQTAWKERERLCGYFERMVNFQKRERERARERER